MAKKTKTYDPKKKQEALDLAAKVGVTEASHQTSIKVQTLYDWRRGISNGKPGAGKRKEAKVTIPARVPHTVSTQRPQGAVATARSLLEAKANELRVIEKMLAAGH